MNRLHQAEPEIREDLQGRIEVFDQSIRSFEKDSERSKGAFLLKLLLHFRLGEFFPEISQILFRMITQDTLPQVPPYFHRDLLFLQNLLFLEILLFRTQFHYFQREIFRVLRSVQ